LPEHPQVRFRLSSIEPNEITDALLDLLIRHDNLCAHLHIPLQSGDDGVLRQMKRRYDSAFYRALVAKVVQTAPDVAVGVDVMRFPAKEKKPSPARRKCSGICRGRTARLSLLGNTGDTNARWQSSPGFAGGQKERAAFCAAWAGRKEEASPADFWPTLPVLVEQAATKRGPGKGLFAHYLRCAGLSARLFSISAFVG
jgi:threonylcarbamoyladenosine tRNA methylthiotransferase MtaB